MIYLLTVKDIIPKAMLLKEWYVNQMNVQIMITDEQR